MIRHDNAISVRPKSRLRPLYQIAAEQVGETVSDFLRIAGEERLERLGFDLAATLPASAHGEQWQSEQYAKVEGNLVVATLTGDKPEDGGTWLQLVNVDEQPFDPAKHYRLKPRLELRDGYVARVFPIIERGAV